MKILFVYPNSEGYGRIPLGMSVLMSILIDDGHEIGLFDVSFIMQNNSLDQEAREKFKIASHTDTSYLYDYHSTDEIDELFRSKLKDFSPDLLAFSIVEDNYRYCHRLLELTKSINESLVTIVGGSTPTIAASTLIENPYIDYLIKGEAEGPMKEFCRLMDKGGDMTDTPNIWYKKEGKIIENPLGPLTDMDDLPMQNLDLWDDAHFVKPYEGKLYRSGSIEMSRGCPQKCTYCINESLRTAYLETDSKLIRKKTVANTIKEAKFLKEKHDLEMFFFCDDNFLAITRDRMAEFKDKWKKEINLPFWLNTTLESVTDWRLAALKECGCAGIGIGVESGNEWVRNEILKRNSHNGNSKLIEVFKMIEEHGIRTTANAMIGFPGETEADMFETVKLVKAIKPMSYDITFVAPYIGTPLHLLAKEKKLIKIESNNPGFNGMASEIGLRKGSIIENPYVTKEKMEHIVNNFVDYVKGELPIPEEFLVEAPGSSPTALDRSDSLEEAQFINLVFDDINKQKQAYRDKKMVN
ncbi:B12-binding domain-containing radical SAM protein [bacterium]|nr:B12-binding domain-containing radical SAM protein [bacterium]